MVGSWAPASVIPAKAGIHHGQCNLIPAQASTFAMDPGFRRDDGDGVAAINTSTLRPDRHPEPLAVALGRGRETEPVARGDPRRGQRQHGGVEEVVAADAARQGLVEEAAVVAVADEQRRALVDARPGSAGSSPSWASAIGRPPFSRQKPSSGWAS